MLLIAILAGIGFAVVLGLVVAAFCWLIVDTDVPGGPG